MKMLVNWNIIIVVINNTHQLQLIKNGYIDYEIIHNATCHLTWAFIESFYIVMQWNNMRIHLQVRFGILNV